MKVSATRHAPAHARPDSSHGPLPTTDLGAEDLRHAYRLMLTSRRLDDKEVQLKNQSQIYFQISGAGHEALLVASGMALRPGYDWVCAYYRDRALALALGVTPYDMLLQAVGAKDDPASHGRQMPSHWSSTALNIISQGSPTGTQCLHAVGAAEAGILYEQIESIPDRESKFHHDEIVYCSLGEGATSEGEFWESLNTASTRQLPVVYVVEDNGYAISVPVEAQTPGGSISNLVERFPHLKVLRVDGCDFVASFAALQEAFQWARDRQGPALVHATVVRPYSHSLSDDERLYKTAAERAAEAARDPLPKMRAFLLAEGLATEADLEAIAQEVDREVAEAADRALKADRPLRSTAADWVFSPDVDPTSAAFESPAEPHGKPDTMVAAINRTLNDEMARNPRIVDLRRRRGGLLARRAPVRESPARAASSRSRTACSGSSAARASSTRRWPKPTSSGARSAWPSAALKPVVEIQFFDYIWPAMMQIRDEITMLRYRSGNAFSCPMVIRVPIGGYLARRRAVSQPVGREHLRALPRHSNRVIHRTRRTRPACCARRSAATTRCCSSSTSISTARRTTRGRIRARTTPCPFGARRCAATAPTSW